MPLNVTRAFLFLAVACAGFSLGGISVGDDAKISGYSASPSPG